MTTSLLFRPFQLGALQLPNRIVMAPLTRSRSSQPGDVPNALMAQYYGQRTTAGLIISEATQISRQGQGYSFTPGLYNAEQVAGWRLVTRTVHAGGGRMFAQLWHVGRKSHPVFHDGGLPVAPSALPPEERVWVAGADGKGGLVDCPTPRALSREEIKATVADYVHAARNAVAAGFDGVEIHGANGYLIDQFLRTTSNHRTDEYGGSIENRARFLLEVAQAVADAIGPERVGLRVSPRQSGPQLGCPEIRETLLYAAPRLAEIGLAYLHLSERASPDQDEVPAAFRQQLRQAYPGAILVAGLYTRDTGEAMLASGLADLIVFGRPFISNPDLVRRLREGLPLAKPDPATFYGGGAEGYTTYASYEDTVTV